MNMFICRACRSQQQRWLSATASRRAVSINSSTTTARTSALESIFSSLQQSQSQKLKGSSTPAPALSWQSGRSKQVDPIKEQEKALKAQQQQDWADMERQMTRPWKTGDVYAPHDLSPSEMSKWKKAQPRGRQNQDVCDELNINPLNLYKNFSIMSEYITEAGRIKPRSETGLRPINQRRMAKAIRRAVAFGLMPSVYRHPELMRIEYARESKKRSFSEKMKKRG